eukprot:m.23017 g.23017  ORF g.23017 m.23017 type:complete len:274 (-) comp14033_c0_seq1:100-921(-)
MCNFDPVTPKLKAMIKCLSISDSLGYCVFYAFLLLESVCSFTTTAPTTKFATGVPTMAPIVPISLTIPPTQPPMPSIPPTLQPSKYDGSLLNVSFVWGLDYAHITPDTKKLLCDICLRSFLNASGGNYTASDMYTCYVEPGSVVVSLAMKKNVPLLWAILLALNAGLPSLVMDSNYSGNETLSTLYVGFSPRGFVDGLTTTSNTTLEDLESDKELQDLTYLVYIGLGIPVLILVIWTCGFLNSRPKNKNELPPLTTRTSTKLKVAPAPTSRVP